MLETEMELPLEDKLDRKRSYGVVYGDPNIGFMQDGKGYRHDGRLYVPPPPPPTEAAKIAAAEDKRAAQSEAMKKIWAERREAAAQQARADEKPVA